MKVRSDYYWVKNGSEAAKIFDTIMKEHKEATKAAADLAEELGGCGFGALSHPFDGWRHGMPAVVFEGSTAPKGWRRHDRFEHVRDPETMECIQVGCVPKKNTKAGKEISLRMASVDSRKTKPSTLFKLFGEDGEMLIDEQMRMHRASAGKYGSRRVVKVLSDASKEPRPAPDGCKRIEEWEVLKWETEANQKETA